MYAINKLQSNRSIYQVDVLSVNFRVESVIGGNPRDVRVVTRSEALLLKTYGVDIPNPIGDEVDGEVDNVLVLNKIPIKIKYFQNFHKYVQN